MKNKILVISRDQQQFKKSLDKLGFQDAEIFAPENEEGILKHIVDANIIFGNPPIIHKYINRAEKLEWMQSSYAGIDAMVHPDLKQNYILTNVKDTYGEIMSEYVFGYILLQEKEILQNIENQKQKIWGQKGYPPISRKTIGIMGTGSIGSKIASTAKHFGMKVVGYSQSNASKENFDSMYTSSNINEFLGQADYVVSVLPNTKDTQGIINRKVFKNMQSSSTFISIGRGANVVEDDLIEALENGGIHSAILDVFQIEPLPQDHKLWSFPNVFITPHVSGYTSNNTRILEIFEDNYNRFIEGKELKYKIDFNKGY